MKREYKYQLDVTTTIYDNHNCLLYTVYDKNGTEGEELLICDIPGREQKVMTVTEQNQECCMELIEKYIMNNY